MSLRSRLLLAALYLVFLIAVLPWLPALGLGMMLPKFFQDVVSPSSLDVHFQMCLLLSVTFGFTIVLLGTALYLRETPCRFVLVVACILYEAVSVTCFFYYARFGIWPNDSVAGDIVASPLYVLEYVLLSVSTSEKLYLLLATFTSLVIALRVQRLVAGQWNSRRSWGYTCACAAPIFLALPIACVLAQGFSVATQNAFHHSLPLASLYSRFLPQYEQDALDLVYKYRPQVQTRHFTSTELEKPRHILLIVVDGVPAKRTPFHGYGRNTMPNLWRDKERWVSLPNAFAQAPSTLNSFRSLMGSQYALGNEIECHRCELLWSTLSKNTSTGFFTSTEMEWASLNRRIGLSAFNVIRTARDAPSHARRIGITQIAHDYFFEDSIIVDHYRQFVETAPADRPTVSVLYLVGTHYPYDSGPGEPMFKPILTPGKGVTADSSASVNSFDSSLVYADSIVERVLDILRTKGALEDAFVVITADHGEAFGEHGQMHHGGGLYDEQVKVPMLVRIGGHLPKVRRHLETSAPSLVGLIDLVPTFFELLQLDPPLELEGESLLSPTRKETELLLHANDSQMVGVVSATKKFIYTNNSGTYEFDRDNDTVEQNNLWRTPPTSLNSFLERLETQNVIKRHP